MGRGDTNVLRRGVAARYLEPEACHGLRNQAAATTYVKKGEPLERSRRRRVSAEMFCCCVSDEFQADGIEPVQWCETSGGIPPLFGEPCELLDFSGVDEGAGR